MSGWPSESYRLPSSRLKDVLPAIEKGLVGTFEEFTVDIVPCPDLRQAPFHLAGEGLCGNERIADIGGPPNLHPVPKFDRKYSLLELTRVMEMSKDRGFVLGAGAGPFHDIGNNSELMPNLSYKGDDEVINLSYYAQVESDGSASCKQSPSNDCALMCNLFGSDGRPGDVLKITAKSRTGKKDFVECIRNALKESFGERPVSLGGVFLTRKGKARLHVMPDFSKEPLDTAQMGNWLRFFEMSSPLVCLSVFHSHDPGLDLRMSHTHCFSDHGEGGHYHNDTTPHEVEYEAYFNIAKVIYRIDRPVIDKDSYRGQ